MRLGLLGDPVSHSRSPEIHRHLLDLASIPGTYEAVRADQEDLKTVLTEMAEGVWDGLNITMPLKEAATRHVDECGEEAARSGSVNTVSRRDGRLVGDSTDAMAVRALSRDPRFGSYETVLVLGTGGAARAALAALGGTHNCFLSGRSVNGARAASETFGVKTSPWGDPVAGALVINATPLMGLPPAVIDRAAGLIDLPYGREPTRSVAHAREASIPVVDGLDFLAYQAVESFRIWTGLEVPIRSVFGWLRKT
jgi:shikimate dehydrogenase